MHYIGSSVFLEVARRGEGATTPSKPKSTIDYVVLYICTYGYKKLILMMLGLFKYTDNKCIKNMLEK